MGIPAAAESTMVARDIRLAEHVGASIAFGPISSGDSVDDIVRAKGRGATDVAFFTSVDHLIETEESVADYSPNARLEPPLRGERTEKHFVMRRFKGLWMPSARIIGLRDRLRKTIHFLKLYPDVLVFRPR